MTSKKSFLVNIRTNARRRVWLFVIMFLAFFFSQPVFLAMSLSMEKMYYTYNNMGAHLGRVFANQIGLNAGMGFLIPILAVFSAVQGFSYMYQRKKLDMYMSVPVSKESRFAAIYVNGILAYLVSYVCNVLLSFLVAQTMGAEIFRAFGEAAAAMIGNTVLYLAVYHIAILAVMLTGNLIVTLMGTAVLLFYDGVIYLLIGGYMETFFSSFYYRTTEKMSEFLISPIIRFVMLINNTFDFGNNFDYYRRTIHWDSFAGSLVPIVIVAAAALGLAYFCYIKKPAEACGKSMAFPVTKPFIKVCITIPAGLAGGVIFFYLSGESDFFLIFGLLAGTLLCHSVVEVIYDFDIRSVKNGWKPLIVSAAGVVAVFCFFAFDMIGYDSYVPGPEQVDHVALRFVDVYNNYYDEDLDTIGAEQYIFDNMQITEAQPLLELAARRMGQVPDKDTPARYCTVQYTLKSGRKVYRNFPVFYREDAALLDQIMVDGAYQKGSSAVYNEPLLALGDRLNIFYDGGSGRKEVEEFSVAQLQEAYRKDLADFTFTDRMEELVQGKLELECVTDGVYIHTSLPVYPSFENTLALIRTAGMYAEDYLDLDNVEQIIVTNNNSEAYDRYRRENDYDDYDMAYSYADYTVEAAFDDPQEMREIADAVYPDSFTDYWMPEDVLDNDYYVTVIFKKEQEKTDNYSGSYRMVADRIPDFVKEATAYQEDDETSAIPSDTVIAQPYMPVQVR